MPKPQPTIDLHRVIESLLFLAGKPLTIRKIAELLGMDRESARSAVTAFRTTWNARGGGTVVAMTGDEVQLVTHADCAPVVSAFVKDETRGELTRPQLEALTVVAYRGPITKAELEQIRGVHCGLILRNLLIRGLVEERRDPARAEDVYVISMEFLRHLGVTDVHELPEYEQLHANTTIDQYLATAGGQTSGVEIPAPSV